MDQVFAGFIPGAEDAPAFSVDGVIAEAALFARQRLLRGVGGMQAELLPFLPYLERDAAGILVQQRRMFGFEFIDLVCCPTTSNAAAWARCASSTSSNSSRAS